MHKDVCLTMKLVGAVCVHGHYMETLRRDYTNMPDTGTKAAMLVH